MSKYNRKIMGLDAAGKPAEVTVDVYSVLNAFGVTDPIMQHIAKKALCTGLRGHKSLTQDLDDIQEAAYRAVIINSQREELQNAPGTHVHTLKVNEHIHQHYPSPGVTPGSIDHTVRLFDNSNSHALSGVAGQHTMSVGYQQPQPHRPELKGVSDKTLEQAREMYRKVLGVYGLDMGKYNASIAVAAALMIDAHFYNRAASLVDCAAKAQADVMDVFWRKQLQYDIDFLDSGLGRKALASSLRDDLLKP